MEVFKPEKQNNEGLHVWRRHKDKANFQATNFSHRKKDLRPRNKVVFLGFFFWGGGWFLYLSNFFLPNYTDFSVIHIFRTALE